MEKVENRERTYDLEPLPSASAQAAGADLVLADSVRHALDRYAEYRLRYKRRGYALVLMYGPPGTGKSITVRMAADAGVRQWGENGNLLIVRTPQLYSANLGETPKRIEQLFADIKLSTTSKRITAVIFEDCEGLLLSRDQTIANKDPSDLIRATEALLKGLDELRWRDNLLIYATANHVTGVLDRAVMSRILYVVPLGLPNLAERRAILARQVPGVSEYTLDILAAATEGMSGRDLVNLEFKAFVHGTGAPEELTAKEYLRALGVTNGNGAQCVAPDVMVEAVVKAAVTTGHHNGSNGAKGKEDEVCQNGQKASSQCVSPQAPSPPQTRSEAPLSWFERLQRCPTWPPLPPY